MTVKMLDQPVREVEADSVKILSHEVREQPDIANEDG